MAHGHILNTFDLFDQNLFSLQSVDGERHSKRNRKWKTFWDSNNQDNNRNNTNLSTLHESLDTEECLIGRWDINNQENKVSNNCQSHNQESKFFNLSGSDLKL